MCVCACMCVCVCMPVHVCGFISVISLSTIVGQAIGIQFKNNKVIYRGCLLCHCSFCRMGLQKSRDLKTKQ